MELETQGWLQALRVEAIVGFDGMTVLSGTDAAGKASGPVSCDLFSLFLQASFLGHAAELPDSRSSESKMAHPSTHPRHSTPT